MGSDTTSTTIRASERRSGCGSSLYPSEAMRDAASVSDNPRRSGDGSDMVWPESRQARHDAHQKPRFRCMGDYSDLSDAVQTCRSREPPPTCSGSPGSRDRASTFDRRELPAKYACRGAALDAPCSRGGRAKAARGPVIGKSIYLINPRNRIPSYYSGEAFERSGLRPATTVADLAIVTVAALVPNDFEIALCDECVDPVDLSRRPDFVGLTG